LQRTFSVAGSPRSRCSRRRIRSGSLDRTIFIAGRYWWLLRRPRIGFAAVLFAALCGITGTLLFLRSPALRTWHVETRVRDTLFGPLAGAVFYLCSSLSSGTGSRSCRDRVTAHAAEAGKLALAGILLGLMSVGSAVGGLVYGSEVGVWRSRDSSR
jgi:hypothetical protein